MATIRGKARVEKIEFEEALSSRLAPHLVVWARAYGGMVEVKFRVPMRLARSYQIGTVITCQLLTGRAAKESQRSSNASVKRKGRR